MVFTRSLKLLVILGWLVLVALMIGNLRLASFIGLSRSAVDSIVNPIGLIVVIFGFIAFLAAVKRSRT